MDVFFAVIIIGLIVGAVISSITEYYTGLGKKPVVDIVKQSATGAATNIIAGLATGMMSTALPVILFALLSGEPIVLPDFTVVWLSLQVP